MVVNNILNETETELAILVALVSDLHSENGGASVSLTDMQAPSRGYMVSLKGYEVTSPFRFLTGNDIRLYLAENVANARRQNAGELYIGTWFDSVTELTYLDLSINVVDKGTALEIARANGQLAVYDVKNERTILPSDIETRDLVAV